MPNHDVQLTEQLSAQSASEHLEQLQRELAALRQELEHSHRLAMLGTLSAGIAHEINNVLTPVLAYAQLASNNPTDNELQAKAIDRALQGVQTATQITQAMLGFASAKDQPIHACLHDVIQSAIECLGRDPAKDRIALKVNSPTDSCVKIRPLALQQVMMNLVLNARNALNGKGGKITINSVQRSDGTTVITVSDNGPGISADIVGKLFEPFSTSAPRQADTAKSTRSNGTGLGLAICRRLIAEAGGTITAMSSADKGTTFTIALPTVRSQRAKAS